MKYIIEFEDEPSMVEAGLRYYQCKQVPYWGLSPQIIKNLTPYTEPDRKAIEDEVWEFCMNTDWSWISEVDTKPLGDYTYQEAKARYEAWKKQKDEIRVGDEVKENTGLWTGVVVGFDKFDDLVIMDSSGNSCCGYKTKHFRKTGRHFDEVEALLKKMRDES